MSTLNISDSSASLNAIRRSIRIFARRASRLANSWIADIIARRERQASLIVPQSFSDRELRDIGLARSQIGAGLAEAAKDRLQAQRALRSKL